MSTVPVSREAGERNISTGASGVLGAGSAMLPKREAGERLSTNDITALTTTRLGGGGTSLNDFLGTTGNPFVPGQYTGGGATTGFSGGSSNTLNNFLGLPPGTNPFVAPPGISTGGGGGGGGGTTGTGYTGYTTGGGGGGDGGTILPPQTPITPIASVILPRSAYNDLASSLIVNWRLGAG